MVEKIASRFVVLKMLSSWVGVEVEVEIEVGFEVRRGWRRWRWELIYIASLGLKTR